MPNTQNIPGDLRAARSASGELLRIAAPTIVTMMSYPLKQFIDAWMVGLLGPDYLAAQGNGAVAAFLPISFSFGLFTVVNTWVAQHLGAGHPEKGAAYAWNALWMCMIGWVGMLAFAAFVGPLFRMLHHAPLITQLETDYARILLAGAFFTMAARAMSHFFYGVHRPVTIMVATIIGNIANLGLDYTLIFGKFGFPALGIRGAGIATVIGGVIEFTIPMIVFLGPAFHRAYRTRIHKRISLERIGEIVRLGWPGAFQWFNEMVCWSIFMTVFIGSFGAEQNAAGWITLRFMQLSFMPAVGMSIAVTAVVGRCIGAGDRASAERRAWIGTGMAMAYMGAFAVLIVIFREAAVNVFISKRYTPEQAEIVRSVGEKLLILAAMFQVFDAMGIVLLGALRGAGDTVWPGVASAMEAWVFIIGGAWLAMRWLPALESIGPWISLAAYIILMGVTMALRFRFGPWRRITLLAPEPSRPSW